MEVSLSGMHNNNMSVYDFCGTWEERRDLSKGVEELLKTLRVREAKIQETLNVNSTQRIWVKGQVFVTMYSKELCEVMSSYSLNGGWRVSSKDSNKQVVSRCSYHSTTRTLIIEKRLQKQNGLLKDSRRVERNPSGDIIMSQRLEFIPNKSPVQDPEEHTAVPNTIVATRTWFRVYKLPLDRLLDRFRGVWVIDEENSDSLRPILEAMNLPAAKIRSALALKTQHSIMLSGPRELLFVHQSVHGDVKTTTHPVRTDIEPDKPLPIPDKGQVVCYATSEDSITVVSTSEDGSSANCDERSLSEDGMVVNQRITFKATNATALVTVNRRWVRAPGHQVTWEETLPTPSLNVLAEKQASNRKLNGVQKSAIANDPASPDNKNNTNVSEKATNGNTVEARLVPQDAIVSLGEGERTTVTQSITTPNAKDASKDNNNNRTISDAHHFAVLLVALLVTTVLRPLLGDIWAVSLSVPIYIILRLQPIIDVGRIIDGSSPWVRTTALFLLSTVLVFYPSERHANDTLVTKFGDSAPMLMVIGSFVWSRFFSNSRTTHMETASDQWLALSVAYLAVTLVLCYGYPKLVHGDVFSEPGIAPALSISVLVTLGLRQYAASGPPVPHAVSGIAAVRTKRNFEVGVDGYRLAPDGKFSEYHVYIVTSDGMKYSAWQRYSAFLNLRHQLGRKDLELPPKRWFNNLSEAVMTERKKGLDAFIKNIFKEGGETLFNSNHHVRLFAGAPPA